MFCWFFRYNAMCSDIQNQRNILHFKKLIFSTHLCFTDQTNHFSPQNMALFALTCVRTFDCPCSQVTGTYILYKNKADPFVEKIIYPGQRDWAKRDTTTTRGVNEEPCALIMKHSLIRQWWIYFYPGCITYHVLLLCSGLWDISGHSDRSQIVQESMRCGTSPRQFISSFKHV